MIERVLNHQYIGRNLKQGHVGLELEVEADRPLPEASGDWKSKEEGSLRGYSMEYVTNGPIVCDDAKFTKIKQLTDKINDPVYSVNKASPRTSLHVHVNIGDLTPNQTWTASTAYWLFENLLMEYCGESRKGNLFCLRAKDAEGSIRTCAQALKSKTPFTTLKTDIIRYAGQNMNAIPKFGSIEYRGMCGTTDPEIIHTWSSELHGLVRNASTKFENPSDLLDRYYGETNKAAFLGRFFSRDFVRRLTSIPGWQGMVDDNVDVLLEFAYYHADWTKYQDRLEDHFSKNPVPMIDPSRIPLGVRLTNEQLSVAMDNGYPITSRRSEFRVPFIYNADGLKHIDWEMEEYLYVRGDSENCPHEPWEARPETIPLPVDIPAPLDASDAFSDTARMLGATNTMRLEDISRTQYRLVNPVNPIAPPTGRQITGFSTASPAYTVVDDIADGYADSTWDDLLPPQGDSTT